MIHTMHLEQSPFNRIKSGKKTIELRLFDEKRKKLKIADRIDFINRSNYKDKISVKILNLYKFETFNNFFNVYDLSYLGRSKDYPLEKVLENLRLIYSEEKEKRFGVLAIEIELLTQ